MKVERRFLVQIVQTYEGDPPEQWGDLIELTDYGLDQYVCDNWRMVRERVEYIDNDNLETEILD